MKSEDALKVCLVVGVGACLLVGVLVLTPRPGQPVALGEQTALGATLDPHLFIVVDSNLAPAVTAKQPVDLRVTASNTAAGDLRIELSEIRISLDAADGSPQLLDVTWVADGRQLPPDAVLAAGNQAATTIHISVLTGEDTRRLVIWRETWLDANLPFLRGTVLTPRLELPLASLVRQAAQSQQGADRKDETCFLATAGRSRTTGCSGARARDFGWCT